MEKISLLLLIVKKTLIGSVIAGILGFSGLSNLYSTENENNNSAKPETRKAGLAPRERPPRS